MTAIEQAGGGLVVRTQSGARVSAAAVIVATNAPANDRVAIHTKQTAYRTYALAARLPRGAVEQALYWDTSQQAGDLSAPYHYVRTAPLPGPGAEELLIVGGEDHRTGMEDASDAAPRPWERLERWARSWCPALGPVVHRWSGQVQEPHDGIAFIGANPGGPDGVFVVTGDSGMGMTHAAIAALMLPDLIRGTPHPWSAAYEPSRKPLRALREFAAENLRSAARYADWLSPGAREEDIAPGTGRVVRDGLKLLAVHSDEDGALHARSAVCPHLGCVVKWNSAEGSWDCPCHGSRFDADGNVLNAPATRDLGTVTPAAPAATDPPAPASR
jgi:nitrite reductase/ring-hydroxylating ferredoxin subunit